MRTPGKNKTKHRKQQISFTGICCCLFVCACIAGAVNLQPQQTVLEREWNKTWIAGTVNQKPQPIQPGKPKQKVSQIQMLYADSLSFSKLFNADIHRARGNVVFRHDSTYMYCDSAYLYSEANSLEAFSNVRIEQGDSLYMYGDYLIYQGNIQLAKMRNNVRMEHRDATLFTDSFNYDRGKNIAYYFDGGMLVDSTNELTSIYGQYLPATKEATFRKDVKLVNDRIVLTSDTLKYWTDTKVAIILGPSVIESDSFTIYTNSGWYNTQTDDSKLYERSTVVSKDRHKTLTADTLFFNQQTGFGEAFSNMYLNDSVKKIILTGDYGWYNDLKGLAMATDSAQCIEYSKGDSLFLHADTLKMFTVGNDEREMKAYYGVRFYRSDLQGVCDSMQFNTSDSVLYLFTDPVLWNSGYQLSGDTIHIFFNDSTVDHAHVFNYSFSIEKVDSSYFNQLKGNDLKAFFEKGELRQIFVSGNAETIFYPMEQDSSFIGMNRTLSGFFRIYMKERQLEKMIIWPEPKASLTPLPDLTAETQYLKGFMLLDYLRPTNRYDIFLKIKRKKEQEPPRRSNKFVY